MILAITNLEVLVALIKQSFSTMISFNELCHTSLMVLIGKVVNQFYFNSEDETFIDYQVMFEVVYFFEVDNSLKM